MGPSEEECSLRPHYFLILRPQQQKVKQHQAMIKALRRGDTVVTNGGLVAKVTKVVDDSDEIEIEIAAFEIAKNQPKSVRVRQVRSMVTEVRVKGEPVRAEWVKDESLKKKAVKDDSSSTQNIEDEREKRALTDFTARGKRDPYAVLGVSRLASADAIKNAYKQLAKNHHPDANKDDPEASERFAEIKEAYEILKDDEKRQAFDRDEVRAQDKP